MDDVLIFDESRPKPYVAPPILSQQYQGEEPQLLGYEDGVRGEKVTVSYFIYFFIICFLDASCVFIKGRARRSVYLLVHLCHMGSNLPNPLCERPTLLVLFS